MGNVPQDQLFTGYGEPRTGRIITIERKPCRFAGCHTPKMQGRDHCYCVEHECDYDTCARQTVERGRCRLHAYCAVEGCPNMRRAASAAKYCDDHATCIGYELQGVVPVPRTGPCVVCRIEVTQRPGLGHRSLFLCREHHHLRSLFGQWRKTYTMSDEQIRDLVMRPQCWICGDSLAWRFQRHGSTEKITAKIHVDHDHQCCDGETSCGRCIRGIAHAHCNQDLGFVERMAKRVGGTRLHQLIDIVIAEHSFEFLTP